MNLARGTELRHAFTGLAIVAAGIMAANLSGKAAPETAKAQAITDPAAIEQACIKSALAPPLAMKERFYGKPRKSKLRMTVQVGAVGDGTLDCTAVQREVVVEQEATRFKWAPSSKQIRFNTNGAETLVGKDRIDRACYYIPSKGSADKTTHGYDQKYHVKSHLAVYMIAHTADGREPYEKYPSAPKRMCRKQG